MYLLLAFLFQFIPKKNLHQINDEGFKGRRRPTLPHICSTIGANGLNFSVRNGKR